MASAPTIGGALWTRGYLHGVGLRTADWAPLLRDKQLVDTLLAPLFAMQPDPKHGGKSMLPHERRQALIHALPEIALATKAHWQGEWHPLLDAPSPRAVKTGRNDPCPCGVRQEIQAVLWDSGMTSGDVGGGERFDVAYLVLSGTTTAARCPELLRGLIGLGFATVIALPTPNAARVIASRELADVEGAQVVASYFDLAIRPRPPRGVVLFAPCSFNSLNKLAHGIADSLALSVVAEAIGRVRR